MVGLFGLAVGLSAQAQQQTQAPDGTVVLPVEMFGCNYVGENDASDLDRSFDEFNEWADENGIDDLTMYLLAPNFVSEDFEFDIIGMNIWPSGAAFGSGNDAIADSDGAYDSFTGVVDCAAHGLYALVGIKPPQQDTQTGGLFEFSNCTMKGNRSNDEGIAAVTAVTDIFGQWDLNDAHAALFNIAGEASDTSYQFKWISYYPSFSAFGSLFDNMVETGGVQTVGAITEPVMDCDSSRMYNTIVMRTAAAE